jgi:hypothetical protein
MKEKIGYLIHTEYHLLLSIDDAQKKYSDSSKYDVSFILIRYAKFNRLKQVLNFDTLPFEVIIMDFDLNLDLKLSNEEKNNLDNLLKIKFSSFIFFQEQDPLVIIMINKYVESNTNIYLYQDGLKPYVMNAMKFSVGLVLHDIKQNLWIKKNGYPIKNYFSFINCKKYAHLRGINKLFLTFPKSYDNWNNLKLESLTTAFNEQFTNILKRVFEWKDSLLSDKEGVIFFMNQPMHDDGSFEVSVLKKLKEKYPKSKIYIKYHPLTSQIKINNYKELDNVVIIDSKIPAELFISQLKNSIILSICSTSMFINNEDCKFYWFSEIHENNNVARLKRYNIINPTNHVISVKSVDEIEF